MGWKMMEAFFNIIPTCLSDDEEIYRILVGGFGLFKHKMNVIEDHGLLGWKISRRNRAPRLSNTVNFSQTTSWEREPRFRRACTAKIPGWWF